MTYVSGKAGAPDIITSLVLYLVTAGVILLMQKVSRTKFGIYMPCVIATVFIAVFAGRSLAKHSVDYKDAICLALPAIAGIILYLMRSEKGLKWFTDIYTYSLAIALLNALLFVPLSRLNSIVDKLLYITNYNDLNITWSFGGLAGIPELVWGLFFTAFAVFPIIYLATSSRRN
ncbi:MAG: hypothetical protein IKG03_04140 [Clostridiales bacterium]|nr:hypothetical protein [Clostridiales bacterium]